MILSLIHLNQGLISNSACVKGSPPILPALKHFLTPVMQSTATAGEKRVTTPAGTRLKRILGGLPKDEYASGEAWQGEAGRTYGFQVVKE